jgi:hypothetical protein
METPKFSEEKLAALANELRNQFDGEPDPDRGWLAVARHFERIFGDGETIELVARRERMQTEIRERVRDERSRNDYLSKEVLRVLGENGELRQQVKEAQERLALIQKP